jgi:hypothetical protein
MSEEWQPGSLPAEGGGEAIESPRMWILVAVVLALTFVTFSGSLDFEFVHDDRGQIFGNPAIQSWQHAPQYFTAHVWAHVDPKGTGNYYRPLFLLWLRVNHMLFGLNPWWWHLTTILAHLITTLLVFVLAAAVIRDRWGALFTALIFGVHPVHVEAVAWVSGVTEPLLGILFIASFLCHLRARGHDARPWRALSLVLFALALLAKETAIMLPMLVFCYEWMFGHGVERESLGRVRYSRSWRALWSAAPFLVVIPLYLAARILALGGFSPAATPYSFSAMILTWPSLIWFWIKHLLCPTGLSTSYDFSAVTQPDWWNFTVPALIVILLAGGVYWATRHLRAGRFAAVWMVMPLLPLLDLRAFVETDFAHDRYLYLPSVGFAMLVALGLRRIPVRRPEWWGLSWTQGVSVLVLAALLAVDAVYQSIYFANDDVFYHHNSRMAPNSWVAKNNLAMWYRHQGNYDAAAKVFGELAEANPASWASAHNLGFTYYKMGRLEEADRYLRKAIHINPSRAESYLCLGLTNLRMNRIAEAEQCMRQAIQLRPEGQGYRFALGVLLRSRGDLEGALEQFRLELVNYPGEVAAKQQIREIEDEIGTRQRN